MNNINKNISTQLKKTSENLIGVGCDKFHIARKLFGNSFFKNFPCVQNNSEHDILLYSIIHGLNSYTLLLVKCRTRSGILSHCVNCTCLCEVQYLQVNP